MIFQAFEFLDTDRKGYVTIQDLRDKLGIFYRNLSTKDYKLLMNHKSELTEQDLYQLLANNELTDFDPVREAFKVNNQSLLSSRWSLDELHDFSADRHVP